QGDRLECTFLAHHADNTSSVFDHLKLPGDTSADGVWLALDSALGTAFALGDGRKLSAAATAVDSGFNADQVMKFVLMQRRKS
ncbi:phage terminase large subunit family protein, partial [Klebsiella pneumoniae]|nr:phage terminase large subunit family protein [Klebsiella pneumoniae]